MKVSFDIIKEKLTGCGLKVTPQRIAILEAVYVLNNHPTAENIITYIRKTHPNIATGTVYKVLDTLVESKLIKKIKTEKDIMRYDGILDQHHHLFSSESDRIEDYSDDKLDKLLEEYFKKKKIPGFRVEEIKLHINGKFLKSK
ncbi:hypothetical protein MNBD_IGNAVI01-2183 [hydrothermal vent metagenome]|uniref:Transcriptional repressor n=1 Tax=hydrothermal vent metagenome TaxID=652676 RepID=A0A3B1C346_9ZZZZ